MCGKFDVQMSWAEYCATAGLGLDGGGGGPPPIDPQTRLGIFTPMAFVPVVHLDERGTRRITAMRWGWHDRKDARKFSHLHARAETIDTTPSWAEPFRARRGVIFTKEFNIGEELANGRIRQWICSREDGEAVAIAVIHDAWPLPQGVLRAFAMITTEAAPPLNAKDGRMPALLAGEDEIALWLGEKAATLADLKALLRPYEGALVMREQDKPRHKPSGAQSSLF
jgi:putative SOS response-associated peptidase YedK